MNRKVIGAAFLGLLAFKAASRHHGMGAGHGPGGRHRRRLDPNDPRRQWIREFHRSLHEADDAEAAEGTTGDATASTNAATAD
ncbi:MAG TPA: hypothetical protein VF323_08735 [Candidatus Limnocylindrales bacterium]